MRYAFSIWVMIAFCSCNNQPIEPDTHNIEQEKISINRLIDKWHQDAAEADSQYFSIIEKEGIYIGTDKTEHWTKAEFEEFAAPYFEKGKAWNFKPLERNVFMAAGGEVAWFDELLATWMGTCRASGVLVREGANWRIAHYHLSLAVPNDKMRAVIKLIDEKPKDGISN